jgi:beta-glucuronidase
LTLSDGTGRRIGGYVTYSGIRSIKVTAGGRLELNGRLLDLRGVSLHEQDLKLGAALDLPHVRRLIGWVKSLGATLIRSHYPLSPELQELADRDGILIWSEIPVWRVNAQYLANPVFRARALGMLQQNILTNQNHPSVLLWSVGNELQPPGLTGAVASYIRAAAARAHALDPTRPVGMAGIDSRCHPAYGPLDVLGWNEYFGWFDAGSGATADRDGLSPALDALRACYPTKAVMITEFGFDATQHGPVEERGTYEFQANSIAYHLHVFASKRWLSGAIYWLLQDFAAFPGWDGGNPLGMQPFVTKGLVDLQGNPKPAFSLVSSLYHATRQIGP